MLHSISHMQANESPSDMAVGTARFGSAAAILLLGWLAGLLFASVAQAEGEVTDTETVAEVTETAAASTGPIVSAGSDKAPPESTPEPVTTPPPEPTAPPVASSERSATAAVEAVVTRRGSEGTPGTVDSTPVMAESDRAQPTGGTRSPPISTPALESVQVGAEKAVDSTRRTVGTVADQAAGMTADAAAGKPAPLEAGAETLRSVSGGVEDAAESLPTSIAGTAFPITGPPFTTLSPAGAASGLDAPTAPSSAEAPGMPPVRSFGRAVGLGVPEQYIGGLEAPSAVDSATTETAAKGRSRGSSVAPGPGPAVDLPQAFEKRPAKGAVPGGDVPSPLPPGSPPASAFGAPGSSSFSVPIVALLALLALVTPAIVRRRRLVVELSPPRPFACALERPG